MGMEFKCEWEWKGNWNGSVLRMEQDVNGMVMGKQWECNENKGGVELECEREWNGNRNGM